MMKMSYIKRVLGWTLFHGHPDCFQLSVDCIYKASRCFRLRQTTRASVILREALRRFVKTLAILVLLCSRGAQYDFSGRAIVVMWVVCRLFKFP